MASSKSAKHGSGKKSARAKPNVYKAHRDRQQGRILAAAQTLFAERGIDRVTMADLIGTSGLQPSTMYQYFSSKDEIVWAILTEVFTQTTARLQERVTAASSGYGRISALLESMADELRDQPDQVRFMAQFDAMYARHWPVERLLALEAQVANQGLETFDQLVRDGIADGSLRSDLEPDLAMQAVLNAAVGTQRRLAALGSKVEVEYGQPVDKLFREFTRLLLLGLQPREHGAHAPAANSTTARKRVTERQTR